MDNIYILQRYIQTGIESQQEILACFKSVEDAKSKLQKFLEKDKNAYDIKTVLDDYNNKGSDDENFEYDCSPTSIYVANHLKSYVYDLWIEKFDVK
jgi:hypothetical protein